MDDEAVRVGAVVADAMLLPTPERRTAMIEALLAASDATYAAAMNALAATYPEKGAEVGVLRGILDTARARRG